MKSIIVLSILLAVACHAPSTKPKSPTGQTQQQVNGGCPHWGCDTNGPRMTGHAVAADGIRGVTLPATETIAVP
jgi:hypothetical protein